MKNTKKAIKLCGAFAVAGLSLAALGGCAAIEDVRFEIFGSNVPKGYTGFFKGYENVFVLGEGIDFREIIDYVCYDGEKYVHGSEAYGLTSYADYTLFLTREGVEPVDVSGWDGYQMSAWAIEPGQWTIEYTVTERWCDYRGTFTAPLTVVAPKLEVKYTFGETEKVRYHGEEMNFRDYFLNDLNMHVKSYYPYDITVEKMEVKEKTVALSKEKAYTFADAGLHDVYFSIDTEDGQHFEDMISIFIKYRGVGDGKAYLIGDTSGYHKIALDCVASNVRFNGQDVDWRAVDGGIEIAKADLLKHPGAGGVTFTNPAGEIQAYNLEVIVDSFGFEDGYNSMVVAAPAGGAKIDGIARVENYRGKGKFVLQMTGTNASMYWALDAEYVHAVFADESVTGLRFTAYAANTYGFYKLAYYTVSPNANGGVTGNQMTTHISYTGSANRYVITMSRNAYLRWARTNIYYDLDKCQFLFRFANEAGKMFNPGKVLLDEFEVVR